LFVLPTCCYQLGEAYLLCFYVGGGLAPALPPPGGVEPRPYTNSSCRTVDSDGSAALVGEEAVGEGRLVPRREGRLVALLLDPAPVGLLERREEGVAGDLRRDHGEEDAGGERQRLAVDLRPSGDEDLLPYRFRRLSQGLADRVGHGDAFGCVPFPAGDDHRRPSRQPAADRLEGLPSHHQGVPEGEALEAPEVGRQPPGEGAAAADDAVLGHGSDERDSPAAAASIGSRHTAMGALMAGCGS